MGVPPHRHSERSEESSRQAQSYRAWVSHPTVIARNNATWQSPGTETKHNHKRVYNYENSIFQRFGYVVFGVLGKSGKSRRQSRRSKVRQRKPAHQLYACRVRRAAHSKRYLQSRCKRRLQGVPQRRQVPSQGQAQPHCHYGDSACFVRFAARPLDVRVNGRGDVGLAAVVCGQSHVDCHIRACVVACHNGNQFSIFRQRHKESAPPRAQYGHARVNGQRNLVYIQRGVDDSSRRAPRAPCPPCAQPLL